MAKFLSIFDFFSKNRRNKILNDEDEKELFVERYRAFREILKNNHQVLMTMGDMQEKAGGAYLFDKAYIRSSNSTLLSGIEKIIGQLNLLSDNRYTGLMVSFQKCMAGIQHLLESRISIPQTGCTKDLKKITKGDIASAGGKIANLGELASALDLPIPPGFVITTWAYKSFIAFNQIQDILVDEIKRLDIRNYDALRATTDKIQKKILNSTIPPELENEILDAYRAICHVTGQDQLKVAVRSSAIHEDIRASFAGQYISALNVTADEILDEYKSVITSQFSPRAIFYFKDKKFNIENMSMAVGVLAMVDADVSGIMYSRDPAKPDEHYSLISAVWGLGEYAVGGVVSADYCSVLTENGGINISLECGDQKVMMVTNPEGGTDEVEVPRDKIGTPCLDNDQIKDLAAIAEKIEDHFGFPQDIEWSIDKKKRIYLLQSRPLRIASPALRSGMKIPTAVKGQTILINKGKVVCRGVGAGNVHIVRSEEDMANFPDGGILVIRHSHPEFAVLLKKATAVISDVGTPLGHLATVARENNVPAIFNTENATKILVNGMKVTVDAVYANVYKGSVDELLRQGKKEDDFSSSPVVKQLREILKVITPLNLTDPRSPSFNPSGCKTLHDITRFSHEMAMQEMFDLTKDSNFSERSARRLVAEFPLQWWVIDLEDGIEGGSRGKTVKIDQIVSIPMHALWEGMIAVPWKGPPPVDTKGFLSAMLKASMDPSIDPAVSKRFADRNYILVARNFCNISARLGFHFSTTETFIDEEENQNYISFVFTGGGADDGRKSRRVKLLSRLLERFDFRVTVRSHTVFARIEGYKPAFMKERLKVLGHIIIHTRQLDMVMYNDKMVDWYYKEIEKDILSFFS